MSLPLHKKLFWKTLNWVIPKIKSRKAPGLLPHRKDDRDYSFGALFKQDFGVSTYHKDSIAPEIWIYSQQPFNDCVWASSTMAASYQEGKRFSVRFAVGMARRLGKLNGNGWASIRAGLEIATQVGRLPYEMLPDEVSGMNWEEYSRPKITEEMLQEALKWRAPNYQRISNENEAKDALNAGYSLITGIKWYGSMNRPVSPNYYLSQKGGYIGGHALTVVDKIINQGYLNPQTFGKLYGKQGRAYLERMFGGGKYDVYILEKLEGRTDLERTLGVFEGKHVRGTDAPIYKIVNGLKCGFASGESWQRHGGGFYTLSDEVLNQIPSGELIT